MKPLNISSEFLVNNNYDNDVAGKDKIIWIIIVNPNSIEWWLTTATRPTMINSKLF